MGGCSNRGRKATSVEELIAGELSGRLCGLAMTKKDRQYKFILSFDTSLLFSHDDGDPIPNFSENAVGVPDMGAQEIGAAPLEFGVTAYPVHADNDNNDNNNNKAPIGDFSAACIGLECSLTEKLGMGSPSSCPSDPTARA